MITEPIDLYTIILSASLVVGGFIAGFVLEKVVLARIRKLTAETKWEFDDVFVKAPRRLTTLVFGLTGIYAAVAVFPFEETVGGIISKVLMVVLILTGTLLFSRVAAGVVHIYTSRGEGLFPTTSIFMNITRAVVLVLGALIILHALGVSITPLLTALGVGGLAVALALQETLSNLFAGIQVVAARELKPGDFIMLETGQKGQVVDVTWRNTTIREFPNNLVVVPNSKIASSIITNYTMPENELSVYVHCGVHYDSDLEKVERIGLEVAKNVLTEVEGVVPDFEPIFCFKQFAESSINFTIILRAKDYGSQFYVRHEFIKRLKKRFDEEGIVIPFPIRTVHLKNGNGKSWK